MNSLKTLLSEGAQHLGLSLIPTWRLDHLPAAEHLRRLFERYAVDLVVDVGANVGQYRDFLRLEVGFKGWIVSFEPAPDCFATLSERARSDERWQVFAKALGATPGSATLKVAAHSTLNSFRDPDFSATEHSAKNREVIREVSVPVGTLDSALPDLLGRFGADNPYLKIDTQGFDLEVLRGAEHCLPRIRALQFEASVVPLYQGSPNYADMLKHLTDRGLSISALFPVAHDADLRLLEFDCIMLRTTSAPLSLPTP